MCKSGYFFAVTWLEPSLYIAFLLGHLFICLVKHEQAVFSHLKGIITDTAKLKEATDNPIYHLRGQKLMVKEVSPATDIQVICTSEKSGDIIEDDTIESFFSHPKYTRVRDTSAMQGVERVSTYENWPVFAVTYSTPERMYMVYH